MFANAIETVGNFTRPIKFIIRNYKEPNIIPGTATLFFVNDEGYALTCKHVAEEFIRADAINQNFAAFKEELSRTPRDTRYNSTVKKLELKHKLKSGSIAQMKLQFPGCVNRFNEIDVTIHPDYDLAFIHFKGYENLLYKGHAVFPKDSSKIRPGDMLCRLGFPFPEFSDFHYDQARDDICWNTTGKSATPRFPIDGMFTRHLGDSSTGKITGIELSTPGLKGQSGGPLFDANGIIYGIQSRTNHLHLGFDMVGEKMLINGRESTINNQPFLHVGRCVHVDIIKEFLDKHGVKYYTDDEI